MKIAPIGVEVFEVEELALVMDEMRPRMPSRDVQLDDAVARYPESDDVFEARARIIAKVARWRYAN